MQMRSIKLLLIISLLSLATGTPATESPIFSTKDGAIRGYDPVAYFKQDKAVKGRDDIVHLWKGATWHFASTENRDLFRNDPEVYAPAFGGYCAYAMSKGNHESSEPQAFEIRDGVLYLNYSQVIRQTWLKDVAGNVTQALDYWLSFGSS